VQRSAASTGPAVAPPVVHDVLRSPGAPLDPVARAALEPRLGHSFADVRVHADAQAAEAAQAVGALAYTVGRHVVFDAGQYRPGSPDGRRLLAHELAHVVQQRGAEAAVPGRLEVGPAGAPEEDQAERAAAGVATPLAPALVRVARVPGPTTEDMHRGIRERRRAGQSVPADGHDEGGSAGPSDPAPTYGEALGAVCPGPWDPGLALLCLANQVRSDGPACVLDRRHRALLTSARAEARDRLARASWVVGSAPDGPARTARAARGAFTGTPPTMAEVVDKLGRMSTLLGGPLQFAGASCDERGCDGGTPAFVGPGSAGPIHICPRFWHPDKIHARARTILHETAHLAGIDAGHTEDEEYCRSYVCGTPCRDTGSVDAWGLFINCLGAPPLPRRTDFNDRVVRDAENL
jgi:hypothetical protein